MYGEKAARDVGEVESYAQQLLKDMGRDPSSLPRGAVKHFCKHARHLKVVRCRSIAEETGEGSCKGEEVKKALESEDQAANMSLYMLLRAADRFAATYGHGRPTLSTLTPNPQGAVRTPASAARPTLSAGPNPYTVVSRVPPRRALSHLPRRSAGGGRGAAGGGLGEAQEHRPRAHGRVPRQYVRRGP